MKPGLISCDRNQSGKPNAREGYLTINVPFIDGWYTQ